MTSNIPILGFSAYSGTGKTTLLRQIIPALKQRGLRVSVIKHAHHDFDLDFPGKDSYELRKSGADQTVISTMTRMAMITEFASPADEPDLQQIIASLDVARRQAELEGYELVTKQILLALELRRQVNNHPVISKYFRFLDPVDLIPAKYRQSGFEKYNSPGVTWETVTDAWEEDEFVLDPTRLTLVCGTAGFDGTELKGLLADKYEIQVNKTSRNTVLFQSNINNSRSATAYLIETLLKLSRQLDKRLERASVAEQTTFNARVKSLTEDVPDLPDFSHFHDKYRDNPKSKTPEGNMREGFFAAYESKNCEHIKLFSKEIDDRLKNGPDLVSANFVIPYPPGFPIMVPGQVISRGIINFMRALDVKEIHGYHAEMGIKLLKMPKLRATAKKR